jgi:hypothetical protein
MQNYIINWKCENKRKQNNQTDAAYEPSRKGSLE